MTTKAERIAARSQVAIALKAGRLERHPCEVCGEPKSEAHHDDYTQPLQVRWFCRTHHFNHHGHDALKDSVTVTVRLVPPIAKRLSQAAHERGMSQSLLIAQAIEKELDRGTVTDTLITERYPLPEPFHVPADFLERTTGEARDEISAAYERQGIPYKP